MSQKSIRVPNKCTDEIEDICYQFLEEKLPDYCNNPQKLDLLKIFELKLETLTGFTEDIYSNWGLDIEGATDCINKTIILSEEVYNNLKNGNPRARFTLCHEIGHALMHTDYLKDVHYHQKNKTILLNRGDIPAYCDSEWQADTFAAGLLMPYHHVEKMIKNKCSVQDIMDTFGASRTSAEIRYKNISRYIRNSWR